MYTYMNYTTIAGIDLTSININCVYPRRSRARARSRWVQLQACTCALLY